MNGAHDVRAGLNAYRVLVSDLVVDTGGADRDAIAVDRRRPGRLRRAAPRADGAARRPSHRRVHDRPGADGRSSTPTSSTSRGTSRTATRCAPSSRRVDAEVYLVELKAAAIDVVAEHALARGAEVVLAANAVVSPELDERLPGLVAERSLS